MVDIFIPFYHLHRHSGTIAYDNSTYTVVMPVGREVVELLGIMGAVDKWYEVLDGVKTIT